MGAPAPIMNDIKVIFFIVNTMVGLLAGLLLISAGVSTAVLSRGGEEAATIGSIIVGLIILGVATLGYAGASRQNRIMLFVYTGVMVLAVVGEIGAMAARVHMDAYLLASSITYLGLLVLAIILAVILAVKARNQCNQGMILSPPPAAYIPVA